MTKKTLQLFLLLAVTGVVFVGCLVVAHPYRAEVYGPPVEFGFEPLLYDGYVVYYGDDGLPFYWVNGTQVWVPTLHRDRYVTHWHQHRDAYHVWYRNRGHQYRAHRFEPARGAPTHQPALQPRNHHNPPPDAHELRPVDRPGGNPDHKRPVLRPREENERQRPVLRPRDDDDEKRKPTLRPKDDDDDEKRKPVLRPR